MGIDLEKIKVKSGGHKGHVCLAPWVRGIGLIVREGQPHRECLVVEGCDGINTRRPCLFGWT